MAEVLSILFFGGIAVFFAFRLFSVLGRHEGHMEPPPAREPSSQDIGDHQERPSLRPAYEGPAAAGLEAIAAADSRFDPTSFLDGARSAYEMIVIAFSKGDRETLKGLLADKVLTPYLAAIDAREARGETARTEIDRIRSTEIADAELENGIARVKVRFDADIATETVDGEGKCVSGDFAHVNSVKEYWTFQRDTTSMDPNWVLASVSVA